MTGSLSFLSIWLLSVETISSFRLLHSLPPYGSQLFPPPA